MDFRCSLHILPNLHPAYTCPQRQKPPALWATGVFWDNSLTMTYFHTGCSTIIGAKSFHGPVRDGKGWYQLAMVIRHDWSVPRRAAACISHVAGPSGNPNWKKQSVLPQHARWACCTADQ